MEERPLSKEGVMPKNDRGLASQLAAHIYQHQTEILDDWLAAQLASDTLRLDLIDEKTLTVESQEFLALLVPALQSADPFEVEGPAWRSVVVYLQELSQARDEAGFSPMETATFILSLKEPLIRRVTREESMELTDPALWNVKATLDRLALYTADVFRQRRETTIRRQQEEMEELATPVVKVWDGILALPLVGTLDTRRSQMVTESLLEAIAATGSDVAILDLTGVPAIDTRMAHHLMRTVAATRLMGANCILCGIRPQIAQTIVHLKIQLGDIKTEATLAAALKSAFREAGLKVVGSN